MVGVVEVGYNVACTEARHSNQRASRRSELTLVDSPSLPFYGLYHNVPTTSQQSPARCLLFVPLSCTLAQSILRQLPIGSELLQRPSGSQRSWLQSTHFASRLEAAELRSCPPVADRWCFLSQQWSQLDYLALFLLQELLLLGQLVLIFIEHLAEMVVFSLKIGNLAVFLSNGIDELRLPSRRLVISLSLFPFDSGLNLSAHQ